MKRKAVKRGLNNNPNNRLSKEKITPLLYYQNPFYYSLLLIVIFLIICILTKRLLFAALLGISILCSFFIKKYQCKKCKRVFCMKLIEKQHLTTDSKPYHFKIKTEYLYSNGMYMRSEIGDQQTIMERVEKWKNTYKCKYCNNESFKEYEKNLDKSNRPKTVEYVRTDKEAPKPKIHKQHVFKSQKRIGRGIGKMIKSMSS